MSFVQRYYDLPVAKKQTFSKQCPTNLTRWQKLATHVSYQWSLLKKWRVYAPLTVFLLKMAIFGAKQSKVVRDRD